MSSTPLRISGLTDLHSSQRRTSSTRSMGERRESVGRLRAESISSKDDTPQQRMVSVAVLPPRLPPGMAPPTGVGMADAFSWDEAINYEHNNATTADDPPPSRRKSFMRKIGLTTQRKRANAADPDADDDDDLPPFIMRQVPYDVWRKHYAKDKDGNYRGTHAPAEDCLLKPEDVQKWRLGDPVTQADKWTRGREALPVYAEVKAEGQAPDYDAEPHVAPTVEAEASVPPAIVDDTGAADAGRLPVDDADGFPPRETIADGKTAEEIINEAKAKRKPTRTWREKLKRGAETAMAGN